jgi:hypothetical protein
MTEVERLRRQVRKLKAEKLDMIETMFPIFLHARALGPKRMNKLNTEISRVGVSHLTYGALSCIHDTVLKYAPKSWTSRGAK